MDYLLSMDEYKNLPLNYLLAVNAMNTNNTLNVHRYLNNIVRLSGSDPATVQNNIFKLSKDMTVHKFLLNYNMNQTKANTVDIIRDFKKYIADEHKIKT